MKKMGSRYLGMGNRKGERSVLSSSTCEYRYLHVLPKSPNVWYTHQQHASVQHYLESLYSHPHHSVGNLTKQCRRICHCLMVNIPGLHIQSKRLSHLQFVVPLDCLDYISLLFLLNEKWRSWNILINHIF